MNRVLIVGCGYVGQVLAKLYVKEGAKVWALQRHAVNIPGVNNILADVNLITEDDLPDVDLVFYLISAKDHTEPAYEQAYVNGVHKLLLALKAKKNTKVIYCSSTSVYGQTQGETVDETTITQPNDSFGKILLRGEGIVLSESRHAVVRFGGIYGPGRESLLENIRNQKVFLSPVPVYTNRIHVADCAGLLHFLGCLKTTGSLFLGVDCEPVLYNDMLIWLANKLKVPTPSMGENPPLRLLMSNKRCLNTRICSLGYQFQYPTFREGYQRLIKS